MRGPRIFCWALLCIPLGTAQSQDPGQTVEWEKGRRVSATRVIVKWRQEPSPASSQAKAASMAARMPGVRALRAYRKLPGMALLELSAAPAPQTRALSASPAQALRQKMNALMATGQFEYVAPDDVLTVAALPSDAGFASGTPWGLCTTGQNGGASGADTGVVAAWGQTIGSTNVIVAVIDTGIRYTHQELAANMWRNPGESGDGRESSGLDDDENGFVDDVHGINAINGTGIPMSGRGAGDHKEAR